MNGEKMLVYDRRIKKERRFKAMGLPVGHKGGYHPKLIGAPRYRIFLEPQDIAKLWAAMEAK